MKKIKKSSTLFKIEFLSPLLHLIVGISLVLFLPFAIWDLGPILSIYGAYAVLLITFGIIGLFGANFGNPIYVKTFIIWTRISLLISILITVCVALLLDFEVLESSFCSDFEWVCILIISGIGLICFSVSLFGFQVKLHTGDPEKTPLTQRRFTISQDEESATLFSVPPYKEEVDLQRRAVIKFNASPMEAISDLHKAQIIRSTSPEDVAQFLYEEENLNPISAGEFLGGKDPYNISVLEEFTKCFDFCNMEFDEALRSFLSKFCLPGEAQKIDRIVENFANQYHMCNPDKFQSPDTAYVLAFSLIMLNTDLHNPNVKKKITLSEFIRNNRGICSNGEDLPQGYLEKMYYSILQKEIKLGSNIFFHSVKKGWLQKMGNNKRWQRRWVIVAQNCLFYFKNDNDNDPHVMIPLEGLEVVENDDFPYSFDLYDPLQEKVKACKLVSGATLGKHEKYIFMAQNEDEKEEWINVINENNVSNPVMNLIKKRKNNMEKKL